MKSTFSPFAPSILCQYLAFKQLYIIILFSSLHVYFVICQEKPLFILHTKKVILYNTFHSNCLFYNLLKRGYHTLIIFKCILLHMKQSYTFMLKCNPAYYQLKLGFLFILTVSIGIFRKPLEIRFLY